MVVGLHGSDFQIHDSLIKKFFYILMVIRCLLMSECERRWALKSAEYRPYRGVLQAGIVPVWSSYITLVYWGARTQRDVMTSACATLLESPEQVVEWRDDGRRRWKLHVEFARTSNSLLLASVFLAMMLDQLLWINVGNVSQSSYSLSFCCIAIWRFLIYALSRGRIGCCTPLSVNPSVRLKG